MSNKTYTVEEVRTRYGVGEHTQGQLQLNPCAGYYF